MDLTAPYSDQQSRANLIGIGWMVLTTLFFVGVNGIVRWIGADLPAAQSAFLRFGFGVLFLFAPLAAALRGGFPRATWRLFLLRGSVHVFAVTLWFYAMARITVAEVTAIGFLNPIIVTAGAALFLGERLGWRRTLAIAVALIGALIVLRPGMRELQTGHLAQLAAACCFGASYLVAKPLSRLAPPAAVVAMLSLIVTVGLAPVAALVWVPPSGAEYGALAAAAACGTAAHYCMTRAFAAAPMTVTQPVTFLQLIWASLLGFAVFHEPLDPWVLVGGAVMIGAISWMTWREAQLSSRRRILSSADRRDGPALPPG
ncbi:DMT family transporter [Paracoccus sp. Z118]|uniref:DMT family transporter n=1 Tax=Paracoccus sp. Z118 TaxID=2851017 RepID=UPI00211266B7|nr:DMT family transporter [Paracoccus sp. Z118]